MKNKVLRIIKWIALGVLAVLFINYIFIPFSIGLIGSILYGYKVDNSLGRNKYDALFKEEYRKEILLSDPYTTRIGGNAYFFTFNKSEILVMQATRFEKIDLKQTEIKNYLIEDKVIDDILKTNFDSPVSYSPVYVSFFVNYGEAKQADIYIDSPPIAVERSDKSLYIKCISAGVILSSTTKYHELMFECAGKKLAFEVMILKRDNKNLIILKYPMDEKNLDRTDFGVSLKDILNINGGISLSDNKINADMEGGKHSGFYKNYISKSKQEIERGINSLQRQILEHKEKIINPVKYIERFYELDPRQQNNLINIKWPEDIKRQSEQLDILQDLLKKNERYL